MGGRHAGTAARGRRSSFGRLIRPGRRVPMHAHVHLPSSSTQLEGQRHPAIGPRLSKSLLNGRYELHKQREPGAWLTSYRGRSSPRLPRGFIVGGAIVLARWGWPSLSSDAERLEEDGVL